MVGTAVGGRPMVRYRTPVFDSARWEGFAFREGDIVISTPPKCGTTWTQMITALLVLGTADFPEPLGRMSPWFDSLFRDGDEVAAALEGQRHRRFVKTHTPFDGLPFDERVTYVCVGRDPRDVGLSAQHHMANIDPTAAARVRASLTARGGGGGAGEGGGGAALAFAEERGAAPEPAEAFRRWVEERAPVTEGGMSLRFTLHHLGTFWSQRASDHSDNVVLLHYDDLRADLAGTMRRLAGRLGVTVDEELFPRLVKAATFEEMRGRADHLVPESDLSVWQDNRNFFHRGATGQWKGVLGPRELRAYADCVAECAPPDLSAWLHPADPPAGAPGSARSGGGGA